MTQNKLAIAIPTFNRSEILKDNLQRMLPEIAKYNIPVYISDDSSNDSTKNMISEFQKTYKRIYYSRNIPSLGHDKNCISTLNQPKEDYIWYLGDSQYIDNNGIAEVLKVINKKKYDIILVSAENRNVRVKSQVYNNPNKFMEDLCWHATLTGVTIYRREILLGKNYESFIDTNFIQLGIILVELLKSENNLLWINEVYIKGNIKKKKSYWQNYIFQVFSEDWYNFILNLPSEYTDISKYKAIKSHSEFTGVFSFKNYLALRQKGILNLKVLLKYYSKLKYTSSLNPKIVILVSLFPKFILTFMLKMRSIFKEMSKNVK